MTVCVRYGDDMENFFELDPIDTGTPGWYTRDEVDAEIARFADLGWEAKAEPVEYEQVTADGLDSEMFTLWLIRLIEPSDGAA